jgi:RimJ/RimL family protein N-acetyltransferase
MTIGRPTSTDYPQSAVTERLDLRAMDAGDADELFAVFADPAGWWYDPAGRHTDIATTRRFIERAAARWPSDGLSYWTARRRRDGEVIGLGGAQRHRSGTWNLNYRLATAWQGHGYAAELARAAQQAATSVDPGVAFIAWIAPHNTPSRRVAERLGLVNRGLRLDASDGQARLAYADRALDDILLPPVDPPG